MTEHYYTVGAHGPPTTETAPQGAMVQLGGAGRWVSYLPSGYSFITTAATRWYPTTAPPTEEAPPPEPVGRWTVRTAADGHTYVKRDGRPLSATRAHHAAAALNALDRDGVVWGEGRPMSGLPDDHEDRVLLLAKKGTYTLALTKREDDEKFGRICWWPPPKAGVGE